MSQVTPPPPSEPTPAVLTVGESAADPTLARRGYPNIAQAWWMVALRGVAAIVFAVIAFLAPGPAILSLVIVVAAYALVDGVLGIMSAFRAANRQERWGMLALEGVANVLMGLIAFLFPLVSAVAFVFVLAIWSLVTGGLMVGAAFRVTPEDGRWALVLSGVVSVLFGAVLLLSPLLSLVVLTWWLGAYALVFGAGLLALAWKLKSRSTPASPAAPLATAS
jgi:uncharacterized membrane protein HdeD (DUF308 family)